MSAAAPHRTELRATIAVAAPLCAGNLAQMAMGFVDTVMVGRLGGEAIAAAGLGSMLFFTTGMMLQGVLSAASPLAAHADGAGDRRAAAQIGSDGLALAVAMAAPMVAAMLLLEPLLVGLGYDRVLAGHIGEFLRAIVWGVPPFLAFGALRSLLAALARTRPVMVVLLLCIPGNAFLNWILIFGHLGSPPLGIAGAGYASAAVMWLMFAGLTLYIRLRPSLARLGLFRGMAASRWPGLRAILRLGLPIGGIMGLEVGVFALASVLMGVLGVASLGANQIELNCSGITFMVPLGIGQAATVRVAFELGAGRPLAARRAAAVALGLGVAFMGVTAVVLGTAARPIIAVYLDVDAPDNAAVVAIALKLFLVAALFQVVDGTQTIAAGALRGYKDTTVPMLLAGIGYWGLGAVGAWTLAFPLGHGAVGLWVGLALGLAVVAVLLAARLHAVARVPA